jgi:DNA-binding Xre family transcriptional regulator
MHETIHIGKLIRQKLAEKDRPIAWLAQKIGCDPSNLCKMLKNKDIRCELLLQISAALEEDFFAHYSKQFREGEFYLKKG